MHESTFDLLIKEVHLDWPYPPKPNPSRNDSEREYNREWTAKYGELWCQRLIDVINEVEPQERLLGNTKQANELCVIRHSLKYRLNTSYKKET